MEVFKKLIKDSQKIAVLTGAGVSTDSGIPDFKTTDTVWRHSIPRHEAISSNFFKSNPAEFWRIYRELFESKIDAKPNDFHKFLAKLEIDHDVTVITQNVDGLHQDAGSSNVIEIHGSIKTLSCSRPSCQNQVLSTNYAEDQLPRCSKCRKLLKPDVVLFDEQVKHLDEAAEKVYEADLIIVAGTALEVYPFNQLPQVAEVSKNSKTRLWLNYDTPPSQYNFTHGFLGSLNDFLKVV